MKIVFFGSSEFARPSLEFLLNSSHDIVAIVTQPDRVKGRNRTLSGTAIKDYAMKSTKKVFQPENIQDPSALEYLRSLSAELFVVVAFGQKFTQEILDIPELYSINLHPSLLPKYRGAAPINWALIKGETKTGLTVIRMNERMDAGDIMIQKKVSIEREDTAETLARRLSELGAILLLDTIRFIE